MSSAPLAWAQDADLERRFGGLRRLYGDAAYERLRRSRFVIIGLGGVGSWAAEALARSGCAALHLVDLDHVAESNVNRQVHALSSTLGMAKVQAMQARITEIHPGCEVRGSEAFVTSDNWPSLLGHEDADAVIDACDDARAKTVLATWAITSGQSLVLVGAAGGKRQGQAVEVADLTAVSHDPLLASVRSRLRRDGVVPPAAGKGRPRPVGLPCVYSREAVTMPLVDVAEDGTDGGTDSGTDGSLNCHGYGSAVSVTAVFGLVAAQVAMDRAILSASRERR